MPGARGRHPSKNFTGFSSGLRPKDPVSRVSVPCGPYNNSFYLGFREWMITTYIGPLGFKFCGLRFGIAGLGVRVWDCGFGAV